MLLSTQPFVDAIRFLLLLRTALTPLLTPHNLIPRLLLQIPRLTLLRHLRRHLHPEVKKLLLICLLAARNPLRLLVLMAPRLFTVQTWQILQQPWARAVVSAVILFM